MNIIVNVKKLKNCNFVNVREAKCQILSIGQNRENNPDGDSNKKAVVLRIKFKRKNDMRNETI